MSIENADEANEAIEALHDEREAEREQQAEHAATKQWLEQTSKERSRTIEIRGREFEFDPLSAKESAHIESLGQGADSDRGDKVTRELCDILGSHCHNPVLDGDAFYEEFGIEELQSILEELVTGELDPEERERIDGFREQ